MYPQDYRIKVESLKLDLSDNFYFKRNNYAYKQNKRFITKNDIYTTDTANALNWLLMT